MASLRSHFQAILLFLCWRVDSGLPNGSKAIIKLSGNFPKSAMVGLRVGCGLINEELLSVLLALRPSISVPRRNFKKDFHQRGSLSLFFSNSKQLSGLCQVSPLQLGQYLPGTLPVTSPLPPPFLANSAVNISTLFERRELVSVRVAIVLVREALEFVIYSNNPLPVTATPARLSKQPSKSSTVAGVGHPAGGSFPPPAPPSAAPPNCSASFPPAWILVVSFM